MNEGIVCRNLFRSFSSRNVLDGTTFTLPEKGLFGLAGPSGCGKSTLLNILSLLDVDYRGEYRLFGKNAKSWSENERAHFRLKEIGYVFQQFNLLELETVEANLSLPLSACCRASSRMRKQKVEEALRQVGLSAFGGRIVSTLSGGEKQRVAIARSIINNPSLLLLDEPTASLDEKNAASIFSILRDLAASCLVLVVSHDEDLLFRHCQKILRFENGKITQFCGNSTGVPRPRIFKIAFAEERSSPRFPFFSLLRHAFHLLKHKKWRSAVMEGSICFGLIGVGLSLFLSSSLSKQLNSSLSSIVPENQIVMSRRDSLPSGVSNVYASSLDEVASLWEGCQSESKGYGTSYILNFEEWFCDDNDFYAIQGANRYRLPGFSVRSINDYQWIDSFENAVFHPMTPAKMEWDEIALGLTYADMFQLCRSLGIERSFESLGKRIEEEPLPIVLNASHLEWGFQDEQIFSLVAVTQTKKSAIFHRRHLWAREILVDRMRFKPSRKGESSSLQAIFEIPFLEFSSPPHDFVERVRDNQDKENLVFEKASSWFLGSLLEKGEKAWTERLYVFSCDKSGPTWAEISSVEKAAPEIVGRDVTSDLGIYASNESVMTGTMTHLFFSPDEEDVQLLSEAYSRLPYAQKDSFVEVPSFCRDAYLYQSSSKLRLSFDCEEPREGKAPSSFDEVLVSSSLFEKWGRPKEIYVAGEIAAEENEGFYDRTFGFGSLKIVGTKEGNSETIYLPRDWSAGFYFFCLGADAFSLIPTGAVFQTSARSDVERTLEKLNRAFPAFRFTSPSLEVSSTIEESLGYIKEILYCFSFFAFLMSCLLFAAVQRITIKENEKENRLLFALGAARSDVCRSLFCHSLLSTLGALLSSLISMVVLEFIVHVYLFSSYGASSSFSVSWEPMLGMALFAGFFSFLVFLFLRFRIRRQKLW